MSDADSLSRGRPDDAVGFLRSIELFAGLHRASLDALGRVAREVHVGGGDVVMRQGESADCLYVVRLGRLRVSVTRQDGAEVTVDYIGGGEVVGEMALISDEPRTATITAERDCELLRISTADFDQLVAADPQLMRRFTSQVVRRFRAAHRQAPPAAPTSTLTVIALGSDGPATDVASMLVESISRQSGDAVVVSGERLAAASGAAATTATAGRGAPGDPTDLGGQDHAAARWVSDLERSHALVVLDCSRATEHRWAQWCTRQSDVVVLVVAPDGTADRDAVAAADLERLAAAGTRVEVVLCRPSWMEDARNTRARLDELAGPVGRHHHARVGVAADTDRIARLVLGEGVTLVLSGGGARGIAQIGVVRALQELDIPIDAVGGTSIGALVAGAVARGWSWERIRYRLRGGLTGGRGLVDLTLPVLSLASGHRVTERLRAAADGLDVEDLLLDYFCVSTNLSRKCAQVHDSGPAWRAVRASLAIPGLFPPVPHDGDVLVDGGLLENFPVRRMRERTRGATVIGVDVGARKDLSASGLSESCHRSTWSSLTTALHPDAGSPSVTLPKVLARLTELGLAPTEGADRPDVLLTPRVDDVAILDFGRFDELVDRGYGCGIETLGAWADEHRMSGSPW